MKYVALLRGINVGGNNPVKMSDLKIAFENKGYTNVTTYINSGNVIFESDSNETTLTKEIETLLTKTFAYKARVLILSHRDIINVAKNIPEEWDTSTDIRCYVTFVMPPLKATDAAKEIDLKEGIDSLKVGPGALYMTTLTSGLTKSKFTKLIGTKIYQDMTMRNYTTLKKILVLMER